MERLLMVVLHADPAKVKAARKLRGKWSLGRARLYEAERGPRNRRMLDDDGNVVPEYNP
jgi:hypothetical protein